MRDSKRIPQPGPMAVLLLGLSFLASEPSMAQEPALVTTRAECEKRLYSYRDVTIELDNSGIADPRFRSPREPFEVFYETPPKPDSTDSAATSQYRSQYLSCVQKADIRISNRRSGRPFVVTFTFEQSTAELVRQRLQDLISEQEEILRRERIQELQERLAREPDSDVRALLRDLLTLVASEAPLAAQPRDGFDEGAESNRADLIRELKVLVDQLNAAEVTAADKPSESRDTAGAPSQDIWQRYSALLEQSEAAEGIEEAFQSLDIQTELPEVSERCEKKNGKQECSVDFLLFQGGDQVILPNYWRAIVAASQPTGKVSFKVRFFDSGEGSPSNETGYLRTIPESKDDPSKTSWAVGASIGWTRSPELDSDPTDDDKPLFTLDAPFAGKELTRFPGSGFLELTQTLGNRARAQVQLDFKSGDLGNGKDLDAQVGRYDVQVYGSDGWGLRFGKQSAFVAPTSGIAIAEGGEGIQLYFPAESRLIATHIVKRESATGAATSANEDAKVYLLQAVGIPLKGDWFRSLDLVGLYGQEELGEKSSPYDYVTFGLDFGFGKSPRCLRSGGSSSKEPCPPRFASFNGSLGLYASHRDAQAAKHQGAEGAEMPAETMEEAFRIIPDGRGRSGLGTLSWEFLQISTKKNEKNRGKEKGPQTKAAAPVKIESLGSVTFFLGYGTGDDPATPDYEGYLGETNAFAPDKLFLATFASRLFDGESGDLRPIGPGLSNKYYLGFQGTYRGEWQPLRWLAKVFQSKPEKSATILELHAYRFDEPVNGSRDAGWEVNLDFQVEAPLGVRTTVGFGKFFVGDALEPFFDDDPYVVTASTSVTLK